MMASRRSAPERKRLLEPGDHVMLGSPLVDPVHWHPGKVLWTDWKEVLVHQGGIAGASPHNALHDCEYVRAFGTLQACNEIKRQAEKVVRDAAHQCREVEEMAADLRRKLIAVFETVAATAIKDSTRLVREEAAPE